MFRFQGLLLAAAAVTASLNWEQVHPSLIERQIHPNEFLASRQGIPKRAETSKFLNDKTRAFSVNGANIPDVDFDVGESYAGLLPINGTNDTNQLYHWFFPSSNPAADKEILIWLTGGPGCSSTGELLQENGPFLWQPGVFRPVDNPWSWHKLTSVVWVDQPVGAGFSVGEVTARDETDVAKQFMGFWKNFVDTYSLQGYKVYITGSSYSGMYCPYIASAMLDAKDETYFNVSGMMVFDGLFSNAALSEDLTSVPFVDSWKRVFSFNDTFTDTIHTAAQTCGYTDYLNKFLVFPPATNQPSQLPGTAPDGSFTPGCDLFNVVFNAAVEANPCFSPYEIFNGCPRRYDPIGFSDGVMFSPPGSGPVYFNRPDVKAAINAPNKEWFFCSSGSTNGHPVFIDDNDLSLAAGPGSQPVIPNVIDRTKNVIIGHGARDLVLIADGTLLTIQNLTWAGTLGFQEKPSAPLIMPGLSSTAQQSSGLGLTAGGGAGVVGTVHTERGLTYLGVETAGHFLTLDAPQVAFRGLEVLLGRVDGFDSVAPFTVDISARTGTGSGNGSGATTGNGTGNVISNLAGRPSLNMATVGVFLVTIPALIVVMV